MQFLQLFALQFDSRLVVVSLLLYPELSLIQGDQIGKILGDLGSFLIIKIAPKVWKTIFLDNGYVLILTQNGSGYSLGEFFTNSFVHPSLINE
jgi:hypothetical protein